MHLQQTIQAYLFAACIVALPNIGRAVSATLLSVPARRAVTLRVLGRRQCLFDGKADLSLFGHVQNLHLNGLPFLQKVVNVIDITGRNFRNVYHPRHISRQCNKRAEIRKPCYFAFEYSPNFYHKKE